MESEKGYSTDGATIRIPLTEHDFSLAGTLFRRPHRQDHFLFIVCHGLCSTQRHSSVVQALVSSMPYHLLTIDFQGNGDSGGTTSYAGYDAEVENLRASVIEMRKQGFDVRGVIGHSRGAAVVLMYTAKYNDIDFTVSVAGRYNHNIDLTMRFTPTQLRTADEQGRFEWLKLSNGQEYVVSKEDLEAFKRIDMSVVKQIDMEKTRVLTVHGDKDEVIPVEDAYEYHRILGRRHHLVVIPDALHSFDSKEEQHKLCEAVTRWLGENMDKS
ncbi:uncharacterized protein VTP21DRAFT_6433 [Calcarisporiella thermophila]|uniref:uncharacterized protein n=1 Tax=Calcarisporiella thermophila TaxID=911321 RepID=UPI0037429C90